MHWILHDENKALMTLACELEFKAVSHCSYMQFAHIVQMKGPQLGRSAKQAPGFSQFIYLSHNTRA